MRSTFAAVIFLVLSSVLHALPCAQIDDQQKILFDTAPIIDALNQLSRLGADGHVITMDTENAPSLEAAVSGYTAGCRSNANEALNWVNVDGIRKNNIIIFAVDSGKKKHDGIYYGSRWHTALDEHAHDILNDEMNPRFRDHEWSQGMLEGIRAVTTSIKVAKAPKGSGSVLVQDATDYSGLWTWLFWVLGIVAALFVLFWIIKLFSVHAERERSRINALVKAKQARDQATRSLNDVKDWLTTQIAAGVVGGAASAATDSLDRLFERFKQATDSYPLDDKSSQVDSETAYKTFVDIAGETEAMRSFSVLNGGVARDPVEPRRGWKPNIPSQRHVPRYEPTSHSVPASNPTPAPTPGPIIVERETGVDPLVAGFLGFEIGKSSSQRDDDDDRPSRSRSTYEEPTPSYQSSSSRDDDDDRGSGATSSFDDNDSGSGDTSSFDPPDSGGGDSSSF